ncbi:hypothetical protein ACC684_39205, partial [Rhizobium ruizarguesonis]
LAREVTEAKREATAASGKDEAYLAQLVARALHVESQVLGDTPGHFVHLFARAFSIQRLHPTVVALASSPYLSSSSFPSLSS